MKKLRKVMALVLAMVMVLAMSTAVFAADPATVTPNGKGTITITNAVKGETYTVYRLFNAMANADTGAIVYGQAPANNLGTYFELDDEGYVVAKSTTTDAVVGTAEFKQWATSKGLQADSKTATANGTLTFSDLTYGYYYVTSTQGAAISVNSLNPNATMTDKNSSTPTVPQDAKKIVVNENTKVSTTSAAIGEDVDFEISFSATNYDGDTLIENYYIKDTPTDMSIKTDTVVVKVIENPDSETPTTTTLTRLSGITATGLNLTIPWVENGASKYSNKSKIVVTYTATVTAAAEDGQANNKAEISWTGKTVPEIPNEPSVKTYNFTLQKLDGKDKTTQLEGAKFELYAGTTKIEVVAVDADGKVITDIDAENVNIDHYRVKTAEETGVAIKAGNVTIKGLKEGTNYQLQETLAPKGYNILTGKTEAFAVNAETSKEGVDEKVYNNRGAVLPSTGGIGTTIFYIIGAILVIGACVVLVTRRRMNVQ